MNLEKIIEVSHKIADPYVKSAEAWKFCCKVLAVLLVLSVGANIYLATRDVEVILEQENIYSDYNNNMSIK
jgi:hypothetical protein